MVERLVSTWSHPHCLESFYFYFQNVGGMRFQVNSVFNVNTISNDKDVRVSYIK